MSTFGFAMMISIKKIKAKRDFCCFSLVLKTVIFVLVQIQILIFCKNHCVYWVSQFEGLPSQCLQLIVTTMFGQLRKLQYFKPVESRLAGFGQCRSQWANNVLILSRYYICHLS